jgi:hypothetical protein
LKKLIISIIALVFLAVSAIAETPQSGSDLEIINKKVQERMDQIKKAGKPSAYVTEIKIDKTKVGVQENKGPAIPAASEGSQAGNLAALNIVGGLFEGSIIGAGCGLIGYSQTKNRDINPLINGSIAGAIAGSSLAAVLSMAEAGTKKYYASDDFGYNIIAWTLLGAAAGSGGGAISYSRTKNLENISEGAGYGCAAGALAGLTFGLIEFFVPESQRGASNKGHAFNLNINADGFTLACKRAY